MRKKFLAHLPDPSFGFLMKIFGLLSFFFITSSARAADSTQTIFQTIGADISVAWSDIGPYFTRPLHFDGTDWRNVSLIIGGTALATTLDKSGRNLALTSPRDNSFQDAMTASRYYGEGVYMIGASGVVYLTGLAVQNDDIRTTGRELLETLALAGATSTVLKIIVGRSRPFTGNGPYMFHPFSLTNDKNSLPSGHTTVAFAISSVLAARIDHPLASIILYGAATCTAFSRMYHDQHWFSDTFLGAAIATATGMWVVKRDEERKGSKSQSDNGLYISPYIGGVSLTYRF